MRTHTITALAMISLVAAFPLFTAGPANANSALEQYVEQVLTPGGSKNVAGTGKDKPKTKPLDRSVRKELRAGGDDGVLLLQVATATATAPASATTSSNRDGSGQIGAQGSHPGMKAGDLNADELDRLLREDTPGTGKSLISTAGTSGVNGPLAVFVAAVALLMGGLAYRRHLRSRVR